MNVYKLEAAIGLNTTEYQKGLKSAGESMAAMGDKIKAGAAAVGKATAAGLAAGSAAVTALAKSAVTAYADYEQLVGGVEKLFGESSDLLMMYAKDAANTAGMSVNAYMETATSFAAALTTSVQAAGGSMDEAVEYADTAMRDMSDNANTFGTDIASIQTAYQGFAKQNYTMLDNLKLGYGGTKAEMERLIEDANKLRHEQGINNDLTIESYADIITAIHEVQTQMKITGTTAREASKTISGSIGAVKAAWTNLTIEMAKDDGDIEGAFNVLGENVGNVFDNLIPRIEKSVGGIGTMISKAAPQITNGLKQLLPRVLPTLLQTAGTLVSSVSTAVMESLPELMNIGGGLLDSFTKNAPYIFKSAQELMSNFADQILNVDYKKLGANISTIFTSAINSITDFVKSVDFEKVGKNIADFISNVDWKEIVQNTVDLIGAAVKALPDLLKGVIENLDVESAMDLLALMTAPKLLSNMLSQFKTNPTCQSNMKGIKDYLSSEVGGAGKDAGISWSSAFITGLEAFGLGWEIGTWLRNNIEWDGKTLGEHADAAVEGIDMETGELDSSTGIFGIAQSIKKLTQAEKEKGNSFTYTNAKGEEVTGQIYEEKGNYTQAYKNALQGPQMPNYYGPYLPKFGNGGRVTQPTLAIVGEKEPETIIPDSKRDDFGTTNIFNITISGADVLNAELIVDKISEALGNLSVRQQRAVGGVGW